MLRSWAVAVGGHGLGRLCPKLTHVTLTHCHFSGVVTLSMGSPGLQCLTLHGSSLVDTGVAHYLGAQLKSVDVSGTQIADYQLRQIVGPPVAVVKHVAVCLQYEASVQQISAGCKHVCTVESLPSRRASCRAAPGDSES